MSQNAIPEYIDVKAVFKAIWQHKKLFLKVWALTFVIACVYILGVPRYFVTTTKVAPEIGNSLQGGALGSFASSLGFDFSEVQTDDAINPMLYPDLMEDNGFVSSLFNIKVKTLDGEISTTYHDYLKNHQKISIWLYPLVWLKKLLPKKEDTNPGGADGEYDPYLLSRSENDVAEAVRANVTFSVDKKTGVISINTKAQDALVCKTLADSVRVRLQSFITDYRTNKARIDYEYYLNLTAQAKKDYEAVRKKYTSMADANIYVSLHATEMKIQDMENDMQLKYSTYTTLNNQLEAAKAKVQERTPAFTLLKGAAMPVKPSGPKRMVFVVVMLFLATFATALYTLKDILKDDKPKE